MSAGTMSSAKTTTGSGHGTNRWWSPVLAGVGALLVVVGALVHFYAVPKLAVCTLRRKTNTIASSAMTSPKNRKGVP